MTDFSPLLFFEAIYVNFKDLQSNLNLTDIGSYVDSAGDSCLPLLDISWALSRPSWISVAPALFDMHTWMIEQNSRDHAKETTG